MESFIRDDNRNLQKRYILWNEYSSLQVRHPLLSTAKLSVLQPCSLNLEGIPYPLPGTYWAALCVEPLEPSLVTIMYVTESLHLSWIDIYVTPTNQYWYGAVFLRVNHRMNQHLPFKQYNGKLLVYQNIQSNEFAIWFTNRFQKQKILILKCIFKKNAIYEPSRLKYLTKLWLIKIHIHFVTPIRK